MMTVEQVLLNWGMDTPVWCSAGVHGIWKGTVQQLWLSFMDGPAHMLDACVEHAQLDRWALSSPIGTLWVYRNVEMTTTVTHDVAAAI